MYDACVLGVKTGALNLVDIENFYLYARKFNARGAVPRGLR